MIDQLVTRLRKLNVVSRSESMMPLIEEAADEIERLQDALVTAERVIMELKHRGVRGCKA